MYEDNIYVKNYEAIKKLPGDIGVQLDQFDAARHLKHWRSVQTGVPELLSRNDRDLLGI